MCFKYLYSFKPNRHKQDYHIRKSNDEIFLSEIEDERDVYVGEKIFVFETNVLIKKRSPDIGFIDNEFPYAYGGENIYFMLHRKYIPIQEYEHSTLKMSMSF